MSYISHEDYKNLMVKFQKETSKGMLKEAKEMTAKQKKFAALAPPEDKITYADKIVGAKKSAKNEYGYADQPPAGTPHYTQYPESWSVREDVEEEGLNPAPMQATGPTVDVKELFNSPLQGADKDRIEKLVSKDQFGLKKWGPELTYAIAVVEDMIDRGIEEEYILDHLVTVEGMTEANAKRALNIALGYEYGDMDAKPFPSRRAMRKLEGLNPAPLQATGQSIEEDSMEPFKLPKRTDTSRLDYDPDASRFEPDYMKTPGEDDDDEDDIISNTDDFEDLDDELPTQFKRAVAGDRRRHPFLRENTVANPPYGFETLPPGTKQQLQTSGFKRLSPTEREQLQEYIESVKTIKKEIAKLAAKAGKKVKTEGGDTTERIMTPSVTSEVATKDRLEQIESKIPEKLYAASKKLIKHLKKVGLTRGEIKLYLNHEIEEMAKKEAEAQHDIAERSYKVSKNAVPVHTLKKGDIITSGEEIVSISAGARTPSGKVDVVLKNPVTGKERGAQWGKHTMIGKKPKSE